MSTTTTEEVTTVESTINEVVASADAALWMILNEAINNENACCVVKEYKCKNTQPNLEAIIEELSTVFRKELFPCSLRHHCILSIPSLVFHYSKFVGFSSSRDYIATAYGLTTEQINEVISSVNIEYMLIDIKKLNILGTLKDTIILGVVSDCLMAMVPNTEHNYYSIAEERLAHVEKISPNIAVGLPYSNNEIDFRLPLEGNSLQKFMINTKSGERMMNRLKDIGSNHRVIAGSSGIGKTTLGFAVGAKRYMIYLECPKTPTAKKTCGKLIDPYWAYTTYKDEAVETMFYREMMCRMLVLYTLVKNAKDQGRPIITPLQWLLYQLNEISSLVFLHVFDALKEYGFDFVCVNELLEKIVDATSQNMIIMIDEAQVLTNIPKAMGSLSYSDQEVPLVTIKKALYCLRACGAIYCSTRFGLEDVNLATWDSSVGKSERELLGRDTQVNCQFTYLLPKNIKPMLSTIFPNLILSEYILSCIAFCLQGRPRSFFNYVKNIALKIIEFGSVDEKMLNDSLAESCQTIENIFKEELAYILDHNCIDKQQLATLWCNSVLPVLGKGYFSDSSSSLLFTESIAGWCYSRRFECVTGEPLLSHTLTEYLLKPENKQYGLRALIGLLERCLQLNDALSVAINYALALSIALNQDIVLQTLGVSQHDNYRLKITRIIQVNSIDKQVEWCQLVLENPNSSQFSLAPGVPVCEIALVPIKSSGIDLICVATNLAVTDTPSNFGDSQHIFITMSNVCYKNKLSTLTSSDQIDKEQSLKQFVVQKSANGMKEWNHKVKPLLAKTRNFSILVDIPKLSNTTDVDQKNHDEFVVNENNMDLFFPDCVEALTAIKWKIVAYQNNPNIIENTMIGAFDNKLLCE